MRPGLIIITSLPMMGVSFIIIMLCVVALIFNKRQAQHHRRNKVTAIKEENKRKERPMNTPEKENTLKQHLNTPEKERKSEQYRQKSSGVAFVPSEVVGTGMIEGKSRGDALAEDGNQPYLTKARACEIFDEEDKEEHTQQHFIMA